MKFSIKSIPFFLTGLGYYNPSNTNHNSTSNSECIGIFGSVGKDDNAQSACVQGLECLSVKGYDSCGLSSFDSQKSLHVNKFTKEDRFGGDCIQKLIDSLKSSPQSKVAISHTRWATHGEKTDLNAHPHQDTKDRVSLVHNGIIENYEVLKNEVKEKYGIEPKSETDSEVIALLIGATLDQGQSIEESIRYACSRLIGSYNLAILYNEAPDSIFLIKNSGQMAIGKDEARNRHLISSEINVLKEEFGLKDIQTVNDNEIVKVTQEDIQRTFVGSNEAKVKVDLKPGVKHYFIQEMLEQPDAVAKCLNYGGRLAGQEKGMVKLGGLDSNQEKLIEIENLLIGACGTSYYASLYGQYLMRELHCFKSVEVKIASEITTEDFPTRKGGLLCVSQSGETTDLLRPFKEAGELGLIRFNIVNNVESTLAREAKCGVFLNAGKEISIASTKAFLCQVVAFSLITIWFAQNTNFKASKGKRKQLWNDLKGIEQKIDYVVNNCPPFSKTVAQILKDEKNIFLLGLGLAECIAKEGSLKLKELTYKHCQAYSLNNTSNGYFNYAKGHPNTATIFILLNDEYKERSMKFLEYIKNKLKANLFVLTDIEDEEERKFVEQNSTHQFFVPHQGYLSAMLCIIPIQLTAFETTFALGRDPDAPRNLTKVVL